MKVDLPTPVLPSTRTTSGIALPCCDMLLHSALTKANGLYGLAYAVFEISSSRRHSFIARHYRSTGSKGRKPYDALLQWIVQQPPRLRLDQALQPPRSRAA